MNSNKKTYYFLGIGGIGMSAIARYLNVLGNNIYGYDRTQTELTKELEQEGMKINYEDDIDNIPQGIDLVIYTPAIPQDSKQLNYFKDNNIAMEKRSVALGNITKDKKTIAISGTHGKTTISGMISHILNNSSIGCSAFLGGISKNINSNMIYNNNSEYVVVEADEYDRSFLQLNPYISVVTAIDPDHLDIYHTYDNLHKAFEEFVSKTNINGYTFIKRNVKIDEKYINCQPEFYSFDDIEANYYAWNIRISNGSYYFDFITPQKVYYDIKMIYPGIHNIENAVVAMTVALKIGVKENEIRKGIETFSGMKRRLDFHIRTKDRIFVDDYAHHPQEISTTIESLRQMYPERHLTGIFQPHLYTRTRDLADDFGKALEKLDTIILLPIYPAREEPIPGIRSELILHKINKMDKYCVTKEQLFPLLEALNPDFLITFGAGDIDKLVEPIENLLNEQ
ncbi:MAG: UDP-N-acetylmuramate--L-alanine ligase [Bacteroidales bacterium]|jgi:UDP-N-acetylmuramate--alanine ligase|nr:UDP-N-acetylmuramate--L-alanine ligase [Bacteroidales bacterium]